MEIMAAVTAVCPKRSCEAWRRGRDECGGRVGTGMWCLRMSQTACGSSVRSTIASRPHVVSCIGRTGEVQWSEAYA